MIKINLLGEDTVADHSGIWILVGYGASMVVFLLSFIFLYSSTDSSIREKQGQVQLLEAQLAKLKTVTKEVKELEAKRAELRDKLAVIATLKRNKVGPVKVMDDLNKAVPEKAWVTEIKERDGVLSISGMALDDQTIATFMRGLESSEFFGNVDLVESKKVTWKGAKISQFSIDAKVNYAGKVPAPAVKDQKPSETKSADGKA